MVTPEELARRAVAAAVKAGRAHSLRCDEPRLLSARGNAIVHLAPSPVVARVSTLTAFTRRDPAAWLAREVAVCASAAAHGGPVVPPSDLVDPGPHEVDGLAMTFWAHVEPSDERPDAEAAGTALAELHAALAHHRDPLPLLTPVFDQVDDALHAFERDGAVDDELLAAMRAEHAAIGAEITALAGANGARPGGGQPSGVLHGDAHGGNLLRVGGRWLWTDLEESCRGPLTWDLAVLAGAAGDDGPRVRAAYARATGRPDPGDEQLAPWLRARELEATVWLLGMAHQHPAGYAAAAADLAAQYRR
ncbi:MAG TPA: phosphotransferase [Pseudonocardiaceae bacterium]